MTKRPKSPTLEPDKERRYRMDIAQLREENRVLREQRAFAELNGDDAGLVGDLVGLLLAVGEASDPLRGQVLEKQPAGVDSVDEGESTRWARSYHRRLHRQIRNLEDEWDKRVKGVWRRVEHAEKVRCRNTTCDLEGKRVPKWMGPNREIENAFCQKCHGRLTPA